MGLIRAGCTNSMIFSVGSGGCMGTFYLLHFRYCNISLLCLPFQCQICWMYGDIFSTEMNHFFCLVKKQLIKLAMFNILLDFIFHHSILLQVKQLMKHVTFIVILYSYESINKKNCKQANHE